MASVLYIRLGLDRVCFVCSACIGFPSIGLEYRRRVGQQALCFSVYDHDLSGIGEPSPSDPEATVQGRPTLHVAER